MLVYKDGGKSDVRSLLVTRPTKKEDTAVIEFTVDGKYKHKVARFVYFIFNQSRNGIILNVNVKHVFSRSHNMFYEACILLLSGDDCRFTNGGALGQRPVFDYFTHRSVINTLPVLCKYINLHV